MKHKQYMTSTAADAQLHEQASEAERALDTLLVMLAREEHRTTGNTRLADKASVELAKLAATFARQAEVVAQLRDALYYAETKHPEAEGICGGCDNLLREDDDLLAFATFVADGTLHHEYLCDTCAVTVTRWQEVLSH